MNERLVCFFYLLLRDELPLGAVTKLLYEAIEDREAQYTNEHLESLAREIVERLDPNDE